MTGEILLEPYISLALVITDEVTKLTSTAAIVIEIVSSDLLSDPPTLDKLLLNAKYYVESGDLDQETIVTVDTNNEFTAELRGGKTYM